MKKAVTLFALSFVFVAFLSAQNDCTGNNTTPKKGPPVNYIEENNPNPVDCTNPDDIKHYYMTDKFVGLTAHKPDVQSEGLRSNMITTNTNFSRPYGILCCGHPKIETRTNPYGDN